MKISIDTDADTFDAALNAVYAAYGQVPPKLGVEDNADKGDDEDYYLPGSWTRPRLRKMVDWLGDSDAAAAVRFIAEHAPKVSMDEVYDYMSEHTGIEDFDGKAMGGRMSAVGFGRNHIGSGVGPLYETEVSARNYRMDKKIAAALLEEMGDAE
ncbi:hypothetical protein ACIGB6_15420 [Paeniglutamicibacter gangotriensis]|uniref:hypothetical protein n=1 Tax=Paeniglutamicibacter gangotriensis TaxID=254787 RepID=UPI0037C58AC1